MTFPSTVSILLAYENADIEINCLVDFDAFKVFIFVSDFFFSELPVLTFYTHWGYEEGRR